MTDEYPAKSLPSDDHVDARLAKPTNIINRRLVIRIVVFSSFLTIFITAFQLYIDFKTDVNRINQEQTNITQSFIHPLASNLWAYDEDLIQSQIEGISSLPDITYVSVKSTIDDEWVAGVYTDNAPLKKTIPLIYTTEDGQQRTLGQLTLQSNLDIVYQELIDKVFIILPSNALKTFCVAGFIMFMVGRMIIRPLQVVTASFINTDIEGLKFPIVLNRPERDQDDEIDHVVQAINKMWLLLKQNYMDLKSSEQALQQALSERDRLLAIESAFKQELEIQVNERTEELQQSMKQLTFTQDTLIERETMASLGDLVAGLCHEINTPLDVCVTVASSMGDRQKDFQRVLTSDALKRSELDDFVTSMSDAEIMLNTSLRKAAELMRHFKQVAVDQTSSVRRKFNLAELLEETLLIATTPYKRHPFSFKIECVDHITMDSFPGPLGQVITNLINNSVVHGFRNRDSGTVKITVLPGNMDCTIQLSDTGSGISEEHIHKVFNPFFTTAMGDGGTGLGLSITYNIVTNILGGSISVESTPDTGATFTLTLPLSAPIQLSNNHER